MVDINPRGKMVEKSLLVGAFTDPADRDDAQSLLLELEDLVDTLGVPVVDRMLVHHRERHARYLLGSGKSQEIADRVKSEGLDCIIFDNELTPSQQRN